MKMKSIGTGLSNQVQGMLLLNMDISQGSRMMQAVVGVIGPSCTFHIGLRSALIIGPSNWNSAG